MSGRILGSAESFLAAVSPWSAEVHCPLDAQLPCLYAVCRQQTSRNHATFPRPIVCNHNSEAGAPIRRGIDGSASQNENIVLFAEKKDHKLLQNLNQNASVGF